MTTTKVLSVQEKTIIEGGRSMHKASDRIISMFEEIRKNSVPRVSLERSQLFTESFKQTEGQPLVLRWAKALKNIAENITVRIMDKELIVGRPHDRMGRYALVYPELDGSLMEYAVDAFKSRTSSPITITPEDEKIIIEEFFSYWNGRDYSPAYMKALPEHLRHMIFGEDKENFINMTAVMLQTASMRHSQNWFHDYNKPIHKGFAAIRDDAQARLDALSNPTDLTTKKPFYEAVVITCNAIITFAKRYSALAAEMAKTEKNAQRKKELENIAEICSRVPELPARTFHEGLQAHWFTQFFSRLEQNIGGQVGNGRMDQILYPLYAKDVAEGRITPEQAEELLQCMWLNMWQSAEIKMSPLSSAGTEGFAHFEAVTIGGQTPEGHDATNELSYLILKSARPLQCTYPEIGVRVHAGSPEAFLHAVVETIKDGKGTPKLINDEMAVPFYLANGAPYAEALDYGISGCVESRLPNRETHVTGNASINYGVVMEMTLRSGRIKIYNDTLFGKETGDPRNFKTYEEFWEAFKTQLLYMAECVMTQQYVAINMKSDYFAAPMASSLHDLAMDAGMDLHQHAQYIPGGIDLSCLETMGFGTVIDSLAAVKKLVYDDKKVTMHELLTALEDDFEGHEVIRQFCLNAPKYGNNDPYADSIGHEITSTLLEYLKSNPKPNNQSFMLRCIPVTFHVPGGRIVYALPSGRKAGLYLSEGISASHGADILGPTAALNSYASAYPRGYKEKAADLMNMKFTPGTVAGPEGTKRLVNFIRSWCSSKLWHIQFNILNKDTLIAARSEPDTYKNLVVRVAGYSAYFVDLTPMQQNEIIDRTEEQI